MLDWSSWKLGQCSVTCGGGTRQDTRTCSVPGQCSGSATRTQNCNTQACPGSNDLMFCYFIALCAESLKLLVASRQHGINSRFMLRYTKNASGVSTRYFMIEVGQDKSHRSFDTNLQCSSLLLL